MGTFTKLLLQLNCIKNTWSVIVGQNIRNYKYQNPFMKLLFIKLSEWDCVVLVLLNMVVIDSIGTFLCINFLIEYNFTFVKFSPKIYNLCTKKSN